MHVLHNPLAETINELYNFILKRRGTVITLKIPLGHTQLLKKYPCCVHFHDSFLTRPSSEYLPLYVKILSFHSSSHTHAVLQHIATTTSSRSPLDRNLLQLAMTSLSDATCAWAVDLTTLKPMKGVWTLQTSKNADPQNLAASCRPSNLANTKWRGVVQKNATVVQQPIVRWWSLALVRYVIEWEFTITTAILQ